jgi:hypothetical protein
MFLLQKQPDYLNVNQYNRDMKVKSTIIFVDRFTLRKLMVQSTTIFVVFMVTVVDKGAEHRNIY